jgi:hypothetical protein
MDPESNILQSPLGYVAVSLTALAMLASFISLYFVVGGKLKSYHASTILIAVHVTNVSYQLLKILSSFYNPNSDTLKTFADWNEYLLMLVILLVQMEILKLFAPLSSALTPSRITILQYVMVGLHFAIMGGAYLEHVFESAAFLKSWALIGTIVFPIVFFLYETIQAFVLSVLVMRYKPESKLAVIFTLLFCVLVDGGVLFLGFLAFTTANVADASAFLYMAGGLLGIHASAITVLFHVLSRYSDLDEPNYKNEFPMQDYSVGTKAVV